MLLFITSRTKNGLSANMKSWKISLLLTFLKTFLLAYYNFCTLYCFFDLLSLPLAVCVCVFFCKNTNTSTCYEIWFNDDRLPCCFLINEKYHFEWISSLFAHHRNQLVRHWFCTNVIILYKHLLLSEQWQPVLSFLSVKIIHFQTLKKTHSKIRLFISTGEN